MVLSANVQPANVQPSIQSSQSNAASPAEAAEQQAIAFFKHSAGDWQSRRRYYTLASGETQEVISDITVCFLEGGHSDLVELAARHELGDPLVCGAKVTWESNYITPSRKPSKGSTVFGIRGDVMYRDRGFATPKPVTADYRFTSERTMVLRTEYNGSAFEEELKLIGDKYRTRQTIISRAGEEVMIGQYLETRV
ncbi:phycobiliprotein lyase [Leptolyngbya sp. BC1307]|uniref:phycobiliprotein lyase n=1 Tax=Leptolyngbya sp. BC1307 TaxID=2029589 RepID=UPI000EFB6E8F|nr:phycobiliprotein lyase [Leptolyngbya sp. BC1307]